MWGREVKVAQINRDSVRRGPTDKDQQNRDAVRRGHLLPVEVWLLYRSDAWSRSGFSEPWSWFRSRSGSRWQVLSLSRSPLPASLGFKIFKNVAWSQDGIKERFSHSVSDTGTRSFLRSQSQSLKNITDRVNIRRYYHYDHR